VWPTSGFEGHNVQTESGTHKGGLFNVTLGETSPISPALLFDHDVLYVEINVADESLCAGATKWSRMSPLSRIQASAYAQRSRRVHTQESDDDYLVHVENTGQGGAIYAETDSTDDYNEAAYFKANASSGVTFGVFAKTNSTSDNAAGGYFLADASSGMTRGVVARTDSTGDAAAAGYFLVDSSSGKTRGVWARNDSTSDDAAAGYFHADGSSGETRGVWAENDSTGDNATAGYFAAKAGNGATVGIRAINYSDDSDSVAGYFRAQGGDIIKGYGSSSSDLEFVVQNDGDVHADGSFSSPAADFAEMLPGVDDLEPGDVLVIGPDGDLIRSSETHQTSVVGVYSTEPGFVGGSDEAMDNPGKVPLAIVGVVPCKASAENGPIRPGDLLVTSSTPGHAMHAGDDPPQGTVVGKALGGLESGSGVIQILVTLQ
jgi:hypothetical protein